MSPPFIHPTANVEGQVQVGAGTKIWQNAHVAKFAKIGSNCNIGDNVGIHRYVTIGKNVKIQNGSGFPLGITIEDDVLIGANTVITNDAFPRSTIWSDERMGKTVVRKGASIGSLVCVIGGLPGADREIGEYALVAGGSVVTNNVPKHGIVVGNPARLVGFACKCGYKLRKVSVGKDVVFMKCTDKNCGKVTQIDAGNYAKLYNKSKM